MDQIASLSSPNWRERKRAIEALAQNGDAALAQALLEVLRQSHQDLSQLNAALQLLYRMDIDVTPGLIRLLDDPDPRSRIVAALALGELKAAGAIPALLRALDDPDPNVRFQAIEALGKSGARQAVEPLVAILRQGDFYLAFSAIEALAAIGDPAPVPDLIACLGDEVLGQAAVLALGRLGDPDQAAGPITAWLEGPAGHAEQAVLALTELGFRSSLAEEAEAGPAASRGRLEILRRILGPLQPEGRAKILDAAGTGDFPGAEAPAGSPPLQDANPDQPGMEVQERRELLLSRLARLLGWLLEMDPQDEPVQTALLRLVSIPASRELAAAALARTGGSAAQSLQTLWEDPDPEVRYAAARALAASAGPGAIPTLVSALAAEDAMLVALAAQALGKHEDPQAFEPLLDCLAHPSAAVRQAAAIALHQLGSPQHGPRLFALLSEPDPRLRESALRSLALSGSLQADEKELAAVLAAVKDASPAVRKAAVDVLPLLEAATAADALAQTLHDPDPAQRAAAARSLARSDPRFARPLLAQAIQDPDPWTRLYACRSLAQFGEAEDIRIIADLLHDPSPPVRITLAQALAQGLGQVGSSQAADLLKILAIDEEVEVRQAAETALAGLH